MSSVDKFKIGEELGLSHSVVECLEGLDWRETEDEVREYLEGIRESLVQRGLLDKPKPKLAAMDRFLTNVANKRTDADKQEVRSFATSIGGRVLPNGFTKSITEVMGDRR